MDCKFDGGFTESTNHSTWNFKCTVGLVTFLCIIASIILCILTIYYQKYKVATITVSSITIIFIIFLPVVILYMVSAMLTIMIRTPEFLDKSTYFPVHTILENPNIFNHLKSEVNNMLQNTRNGNDLTLTRDTYGGLNKNIGKDVKEVDGKTNGWRVLNIKAGKNYSPHAKHFPLLKKILENHPEIMSCAISVLEPGIKIPIHVGYYKGFMRYMLATHVPVNREDVFLCVNGKKYNWTEGEGVLWDDNYPHKVFNHTEETRVVIYMDIERPFTGMLKHINRAIMNLAANSKTVKNEVSRTERQVKI